MKNTKDPINNLLFTADALESVVNFNLEAIPEWNSPYIEIAKTKWILNLYMTAFDIKDTETLFHSLKWDRPESESIDYINLQQIIVDAYLIAKGQLELWHKKYRRQYMRDRAVFFVTVELQNILNKKYVPETSMRSLGNIGIILNRQREIKSAVGKQNNKTLRDMLFEEMRKPDFFAGCNTKHAKKQRIIKASAKYPRKAGKSLAISDRTAGRYLELLEME